MSRPVADWRTLLPTLWKVALWGALRKALPAGSVVIGARVVVLGEVA